MNQTMTSLKPDVICACSGTTRDSILKLITEGVTDPERISRITGVCSGCGGCESEISQLLAEQRVVNTMPSV